MGGSRNRGGHGPAPRPEPAPRQGGAGQDPDQPVAGDCCRCGTGRPSLATLTAQDLAFKIAPRFNASGRLGDADIALTALTARVPSQAKGAALQLDRINAKDNASRRKVLDEIEETLLSAQDHSPLRGLLSSPEPAGIGGSSGSWPPSCWRNYHRRCSSCAWRTDSDGFPAGSSPRISIFTGH